MGKKAKIAATIIITLIALAGVLGYIGFSFTDSDVYLGVSEITDNITSDGNIANPTFSGNIKVVQETYIYNSGVLDIEDLTVDIQVFFSGNVDPTEVELGSDTNLLGTVGAGQNVSKTIEITLSNYVARLAIEDGTLRIVIDTTLQIQNIPYTIELPQQETTESWTAPFPL